MSKGRFLVQAKAKANAIAMMVLGLLTLVACRPERPKEVIPPARMEEILYDYHLAQVMGSDMGSADAYKRGLYIDYVFQKHHITRAELDSSLVWYARNPKDLATIYDHLSQRADREMEYIKDRQAQAITRVAQPVVGDSADLWYDTRLVLLTPTPLDNKRMWSIPTDSNFHVLDSIVWTLQAMFIPNVNGNVNVNGNMSRMIVDESADVDSVAVADTAAVKVMETSTEIKPSKKAILSLIIRYDGDSILARDVVLTDDAATTISLHNTDSAIIRSIRMSAYFVSPDPTDHLLLSSNHLLRYRTQAPAVPDSLTTVNENRQSSESRDELAQSMPSRDGGKDAQRLNEDEDENVGEGEDENVKAAKTKTKRRKKAEAKPKVQDKEE